MTSDRADSLRKFLDMIGTETRNPPAQSNDSAEIITYGTPYDLEESVPHMTDNKKWCRDFQRYYATSPTDEAIPAGMYHCGSSPNIGCFLEKQPINTDSLLELPDDAMTEVFEQFNEFWKREDKFRDRGMLFKRGYLFWGEPGSGKTSAAQLLIKRVVENLHGVVVVCDHPALLVACLKMLRQVEPRRPVMVIIEDIDALIERHGEPNFLSMLDGESQIDNVVFVASTNYPGRLPQRLIDRPSRFDVIREVGMPSAAAREVYLRAKETSLSDNEIKQWVALSDGFSIAHLKEMIIAVKVFDQPIVDVVDRLRQMGATTLPVESTKRGKETVGLIPFQKKIVTNIRVAKPTSDDDGYTF